MEENRKHIDKLFHEELGNYTETPSPAVWESLDRRLDEHYKKDRKVVSYRWLWYVLLAALVASVLYLALSGTFSIKQDNKTKVNIEEKAPEVINAISASGNSEPPTMPEHKSLPDSTNQTVEKANNSVSNNSAVSN